MRFKAILIIFMISFVLGACSGSEQAPEDDTGTPQAEAPETPEAAMEAAVTPVALSPEDQAKAARAPEGMVFVKGGCFIMGNNFAQEDERPEHEVCVDDFYMDKTEVTQARWEKVMQINPSRFIGADLPVEQVNYYDVQEFVRKSQGACRLPTEAEWEYAARGGTDTRYFWGNMMDGAYAWFVDNSDEKTHPVGQTHPNQYGIYDLLGNVWEWTEDWYEPYYSIEKKDNPTGAAKGEYKVIRGGAFDSSAGALRPTNRTWLHPKNRVFPKVTSYGQIMNEIYNYIGFRCVQPVESAQPVESTQPVENAQPAKN